MQRRRKKVRRGALTQVEIKEVVLDGDQGLVEGGWNFSSPICDDGEGGGASAVPRRGGWSSMSEGLVFFL
jgi:hypothetical protein